MAIYIVKPEAIEHRKEIREFIEKNSFLTIRYSKLMILNDEAIHYLFIDDRGTALLNAIKQHMLGKRVEVNIVVSGERSEEELATELVRVTGAHFNPKLCDPNTVRAIFGSSDFMMYHNQKYFLNAIHRSSPQESQEATEWLKYNIFEDTTVESRLEERL